VVHMMALYKQGKVLDSYSLIGCLVWRTRRKRSEVFERLSYISLFAACSAFFAGLASGSISIRQLITLIVGLPQTMCGVLW